MEKENRNLPNRQDGKSMPMRKTEQTIGALLIFSLVLPIINWSLLLSHFFSSGNNVEGRYQILKNENLFRLNIFNEMVSGIVILILSVLLFNLLKKQNRTLALLAFSFRSVEVILTISLALIHFVLLLIIKESEFLNLGFDGLAFADLVLKKHIQITSFLGVFFALSMFTFSILFVKSRYIPVGWAIFGVVSYLLIFIYDTTTILYPEFTEIALVQIVCTVPMVLFHIIMGSYLILKTKK